MTLKADVYSFECSPMPWTEHELGIDNITIEVCMELSLDEIEEIITMIHWAWNERLFEKSTSEMVCSNLLKMKIPYLYNKIQTIAHQQFTINYTNDINLEGYGDYEIFCPDEIISVARKMYNTRF